ncbi:unnamed protein product [Lampetra planeri]
MTKGWERLEGRIDRLTDAVPQLVVQLAGEEERPGAVEMVAGEPAVGAVRSTAAEAREPGMLGAVGAAGAPSPETAPVARERALDRIHRLGPFKEFVAAGGNWGVFTRRFEAAYQALDWTEEEALKALPRTLNEMGVVLPIVEEEAQTSLWVVQCVRAQEEMNQRT